MQGTLVYTRVLFKKKINKSEKNRNILLASPVFSIIAYLVLVIVELIAVARFEDFEAVRA